MVSCRQKPPWGERGASLLIDRGKTGTKRSVRTDGRGVPIVPPVGNPRTATDLTREWAWFPRASLQAAARTADDSPGHK